VRDPLEAGISIAPCFAYTGEPKYEYAVAYMPRRGAKLCEAVSRTYDTLRYVAIDCMREDEVARVMKYSSIYLATAEYEGFGLPALEAMSAGCVVVSVPALGGMEYLNDGVNCRVVGPQDFTAAVGELLQEKSAVMRFRMRQAAVATARRYTTGRMMQRLSALLDGSLSSWRRGS
jgi:glycosyltransferase involved in cell wall biosynthesis